MLESSRNAVAGSGKMWSYHHHHPRISWRVLMQNFRAAEKSIAKID